LTGLAASIFENELQKKVLRIRCTGSGSHKGTGAGIGAIALEQRFHTARVINGPDGFEIRLPRSSPGSRQRLPLRHVGKNANSGLVRYSASISGAIRRFNLKEFALV